MLGLLLAMRRDPAEDMCFSGGLVDRCTLHFYHSVSVQILHVRNQSDWM